MRATTSESSRPRCRAAKGADILDGELAARLNERLADSDCAFDHTQSLFSTVIAALCWGVVAVAAAMATIWFLV